MRETKQWLWGLCIWACLALRLAHAAMITGPWLQAMTETSVSVMWEADRLEPASVEYGEAFAESSQATATVVPEAADGTGRDTRAILYTARLTHLQPGTTYPYRVRSGETVSAQATFSTHSSTKQTWKVAHISDTHTFRLSHTRRGFAAVIAQQPDYVILAGDVAETSTNQDYREHMQHGGELWRHTPHYTVRGNHDSRTWSTYLAWFDNAVPGAFSEDFYTVDIGPVTYIGINANQIKRLYPEGALAWLDAQLQAHAHRPWTIVVLKPDPASTWTDYAAERARFLMPLFARHGVDLVLAGGNRAGFRRNVDGVWYLHAGLGTNRGFYMLDIGANDIAVRYHRQDGVVVNSFVIHRTGEEKADGTDGTGATGDTGNDG